QSAYKKSEDIINKGFIGAKGKKKDTYVRKFMENNDSSITSKVAEGLGKSNWFDSNADRFVRNINKKSEKDAKRRNKKITIDEKVNNGSYNIKDAGAELKDGIANTLSDAFEKRNLIKSSLNSLSSIRPLSSANKASGGRFSAMGRMYNSESSGLDRFRDAKKNDARTLAENHLINKEEITPERLYDKRWYKNNDALIKQFEGRDERRKMKKKEFADDKKALGRVNAYKNKYLPNEKLTSLKLIKKVASQPGKLVGGLSKSADKVNGGFSSILTASGFRNEYNPKEREKIEKIIDRIEIRGGTKELDRVVDEVGKKFEEFQSDKDVNLKMKDGESKDLINDLIGEFNKFGSEDVEKVKKRAKEFLLEEGNGRDWRELFTDTEVVSSDASEGPVINPALKEE
ncbi:MAG: hypothetical protein ACI9W5_000122, partial [Ulvibacter sp.]